MSKYRFCVLQTPFIKILYKINANISLLIRSVTLSSVHSRLPAGGQELGTSRERLFLSDQRFTRMLLCHFENSNVTLSKIPYRVFRVLATYLSSDWTTRYRTVSTPDTLCGPNASDSYFIPSLKNSSSGLRNTQCPKRRVMFLFQKQN